MAPVEGPVGNRPSHRRFLRGSFLRGSVVAQGPAKTPRQRAALLWFRGHKGITSMPKERPDVTIDHLLGELEAAIMRMMWTMESSTVRGVFDLLRAEGRSLAYTTVMTVMARLTEKDLLTRELSGKTHVYRAASTEDQFVRATAAKRVQALVDEFGDLAIAQFVATVSDLSPERYAQLERIARGDEP